MPNVLTITTENPDQILNAGLYGAGALIRVQTATTETGTFGDVTGTGSTPTIPVVTATRSYTGYDPAGIVSSWYRTRYENAGATRLSDWTPAFQVGDETSGLLCSLYDVQQELGGTTTANDNELILEKIRQVSVAIEGFVGQWLAPRPTDPASSMTLLFDVPWMPYTYFARRSLLLDRGARLTGIRSFSAVGTAATDQPDTGGTYTAATLTDILMRPWPSADGPATRIELLRTSSSIFSPGRNTVQVTGSFGYAVVPADIQGVAIRAATRRFLGKGAGGVSVAIGPNGTEILLPDLSGADRTTLVAYKIPNVA
jgi:hypothetical protein